MMAPFFNSLSSEGDAQEFGKHTNSSPRSLGVLSDQFWFDAPTMVL